jgi:hypothetical protein
MKFLSSLWNTCLVHSKYRKLEVTWLHKVFISIPVHV